MGDPGQSSQPTVFGVKTKTLLNRKYEATHREERREKCRNYYWKNRDNQKKRVEDYRKKYPSRVKETQLKHYNKKKDSEDHKHKNRARVRLWRKYNPDRLKLQRRFNSSKRNASILKRTPKWLTENHWREIKLRYQYCPEGFEVDHIVPLQGKLVSGLHVPWNLQYLPSSENSRKTNKFEPVVVNY